MFKQSSALEPVCWFYKLALTWIQFISMVEDAFRAVARLRNKTGLKRSQHVAVEGCLIWYNLLQWIGVCWVCQKLGESWLKNRLGRTAAVEVYGSWTRRNALEYVVETNVDRRGSSAGALQAAREARRRRFEDDGRDSWALSTKEDRDNQRGTRNSTDVWTVGRSWMQGRAKLMMVVSTTMTPLHL